MTTMESYIDNKKKLYKTILEFLEDSEINYDREMDGENFKILSTYLKIYDNEGDPEEMQQFLQIIKNISDHHHRDKNFINKIIQILQYFKDHIKQTLSNIELFHLFEKNKLIILYLLKNSIIEISDQICTEIMNKFESNGNRYCYFFYPELENFLGEEKMKDIKDELLNKNPSVFDNFDEKRQEGENDSYICSLIRHDSVVEFIGYVNCNNYPLSSEILPSIFETNLFLITRKNTTLIEYSAFFGSFQIFQYLMMNKIELKSSLWLYTIHSKNAELIHLLESNKVSPPECKIGNDSNYLKCFIESIKCHHNDIANYIEINLLNQNVSKQKEEIISNYMKYHNYDFFQIDAINEFGFFYLHYYNYNKLLAFLLKEKEKEIEKRIAAENDDIEVIYCLLLKEQRIARSIFLNNSKLTKIIIPSSITSIQDEAFSECLSLKKISIPSSVKRIESFTFSRCLSLEQIIIPSSVIEIGNCVFTGCKSLAKITIPSSVTNIGTQNFRGIESLKINGDIKIIRHWMFAYCSFTQIIIPSSVTEIESFAFKECTSLRQIIIPPSVTKIGRSAFIDCSSLTQISIPSSVTQIEIGSFSGCRSLPEIIIPSSVTHIGSHAFSKCKSLEQFIVPSSIKIIEISTFDGCKSLEKITIPSSVVKIGINAFRGVKSLEIIGDLKSIHNCMFSNCSSLTNIIISSSVTEIESFAFSKCSSLTQISIPSSVTKIDSYSFEGCSSLTQIIIPSSVAEIGDSAFKGCSSLKKVTFESSSSLIKIGNNAFEGCPLSDEKRPTLDDSNYEFCVLI